jgi:hypothetical protein
MIPKELEIRTGSKKRQRFWATSSGTGRRTFGKPPATIN